MLQLCLYLGHMVTNLRVLLVCMMAASPGIETSCPDWLLVEHVDTIYGPISREAGEGMMEVFHVTVVLLPRTVTVCRQCALSSSSSPQEYLGLSRSVGAAN